MNKTLIAILGAATALAGCAATPPVATVGEGFTEGTAKSCTPSPIDLSASATASATIAMTNDGWCAVRAVEKDGSPFRLGLVRARPEHGHVLIQKVGNITRIEYTADARYVGADRFTVALRSRNPSTPDATVQVAVNVTMGEGMAAPAPTPAPAPARAPATRTPARRPAR